MRLLLLLSMKKVLLSISLFLFMMSALVSQSPKDYIESTEPLPYLDQEFHEPTLSLRRGEIIFFGSYPLTVLFSSTGYSLYRYFAGGMNESSLPPMFGGETNFNSRDQAIVLISAGVLSLTVALIDYFIVSGNSE